MEDLLKLLKGNLHIFHDTEDDILRHIISSSIKDIESVGGDMSVFEEETKELVVERSRYVYNDSLEFFYDNFREQLLNLSFRTYTHNLKKGDNVD